MTEPRLVAGTDPYPWPYDGRISGGHLALVLAGWDDHWSGRCADADAATARCAVLALAVQRIGGLVVQVVHGTAAVAASPATEPLVVAAPAIDGFYDAPLDSALRAAGRTHLLVAGHGLEGPVHSTLRSANDRGYECLLVADACSSLTDDLTAASVKTVTMSGGIFGAVGSSVPVLDALLDAVGDATHNPPVPVIAQEA